MPQPTISRGTLSQQAYEWLRHQILVGQIVQGERISESAVAQTLGVSATPVREAIRLLAGDGLVDYNGRKGASVIRPTEQEIRHCFAVRASLETLAVREANERLTPEDVQELERLAHATSGDGHDEKEAFFQGDRAFHSFIVRKADNTWLSQFLEKLTDFLTIVRQPLYRATSIGRTNAEHLEVARALAEGDAERADRLLAEHISRVCSDVVLNHRRELPARAQRVETQDQSR